MTEKQTEAKKIYQQHRDRQRMALLAAAKKLFIEKGIQGTTLGDIAVEAGVTRVTVYQYFTNQSDIAWAILERIFESSKEVRHNALQLDGTGYERIAACLAGFLQSLIHDPGNFCFLAQFDSMYAGKQDVARLLEMTQRIFGGAPALVTEIIRKGIEDGSLRSNLNPALTAATIVNVALATGVRLTIHRKSVEIEYGHTIEQIFGEACQLLLQGIRTP
ncbi:hypothetical protein KSF_001210 [Reticulibacter mediterranei]|uniref:HTH tetR-type domain-containing protein n=1 Tax=Reticulibacter mediterranei TaxID=2778369 RepID=A0A8J3ICR7_9CHLR|nr:TetR/AcrR family transcriptional regulator [Reticulibacter mediterranei]GHO90073.1 hypothetical protein KSF_001210 [Reticulibacter mediterranei]